MLALILVKRLVDDPTEFDLNVRRSRLMLPRESVLHPLLIITLRSWVSKP